MTEATDKPLALKNLVDIQGFLEISRSFSELFGVGIRLFDSAGQKLVDIRASTSDHCGYLFTVHPTKVLCTQLVNEIRSCPLGNDAREAVTFDCFSHLRYKVVPVIYEGTPLGRVIFGPYAPEGLKGPPSQLKIYEDKGLDLSVLANYQKSIPRAGEEAVGKVLDNIRHVLEVIIHSSYKTYLTSQMHIQSLGAAFSDLEKANRELTEANQHLQDLDRLKSNFVATVSHELRTPLTSVIGYSEMLLEGMAGEISGEQRDYVQTILEKGESLLRLIGQVLDMSRIESGNIEMHRASVKPKELIDASLSDVAPQAQQRSIQLNVEVAKNVTPIEIDSDKVRRVLTNLLGNAVKFTDPGGLIEVKAEMTEEVPLGSDHMDIFQPERNKFLSISVTDTGVGIPRDKIKNVFESFFQVDNSSTREFGGTGLGLSIARNFIRAHGGEIRAQSTEGEGSTFTVLLPYHFDSLTNAIKMDGIGVHQ